MNKLFTEQQEVLQEKHDSCLYKNLLTFFAMSAIMLFFIARYEWSYKAVAGFYDQTSWAVSGTLTNWTIGFALFWPGIGGCTVLLVKDYLLKRGWSDKKARITAIWCVLPVAILCTFFFKAVGFAGFRW